MLPKKNFTSRKNRYSRSYVDQLKKEIEALKRPPLAGDNPPLTRYCTNCRQYSLFSFNPEQWFTGPAVQVANVSCQKCNVSYNVYATEIYFMMKSAKEFPPCQDENKESEKTK